MISVSALKKEFGDRVLFRDAAFQLNPGSRYGLVGANGSGKTTLLRILSGDEEASGGVVAIPSKAKLGVLRQDQFLYEHEPIIGVAMMGDPVLWQALVERDEVLAKAHEHFDADRFQRLEETIVRHDGYTAESRAAEILEGLGIPAELHHQPLSVLSGGFKLRVLLAQVLAGAPDALLLDEPTNHLDIISIRWLERFLRNFAGPVVVISHDHRFLDNVVTHILDVDYETVTLYHGDYQQFMEQKKEDRERREKEIEGREKEIARVQVFVDRFKAKNTKARQAQSKMKLIEKMADELTPLAPSSRRWPNFRFRERRHSGKEVLDVKDVRKSYGEKEVLHGVDLHVRRGDRLAIIGPNGIGKSTLLKIAVGTTPADAGSAEWGYAAQVGYFAQDFQDKFKDGTDTVENWLLRETDSGNRGIVRAALGAVLFSGEDAEKPVSALSGGEAARLEFARLAFEKPNILVLDEPTNHLDLESIEALVDGLKEYDGTLIFVSHDRWFVGELANRIVEIRREGIRDFPGTYDEYIHASGDDHLDVDRAAAKPSSERRTSSKETKTPNGKSSGGSAAPQRERKPDPYREARLAERRAELESEIEAAETRIAEIERTFADPTLYQGDAGADVKALEGERAALQAKVERWMAEWAEAAEA